MLDKTKTIEAITEQIAVANILTGNAEEGSTDHTKGIAQLSALYWMLTLIKCGELEHSEIKKHEGEC